MNDNGLRSTFDGFADIILVSVNEVVNLDAVCLIARLLVRNDRYGNARDLHFEFVATVLEADDVPELFWLMCAKVSHAVHCCVWQIQFVALLSQIVFELTLFFVRASGSSPLQFDLAHRKLHCGFLLLHILVNVPEKYFQLVLTARLEGVGASSLSAAVDAHLLSPLRAGCLIGEPLLLAGVLGLALGAIAAASWPSGGRWFADEFVLRSRIW
jgi:hypothetical protein